MLLLLLIPTLCSSYNKGISCTYTLLKTDALSILGNFESPDSCQGDTCVKQLAIYVGDAKYKLGLNGKSPRER
jgi:hypothetical protein